MRYFGAFTRGWRPVAVAVAALAIVIFWHGYGTRPRAPLPTSPIVFQATPAPLARWPWPGAQTDALYRGVTQWFVRSCDGTTLDLLRFDFRASPTLRFELYDQDEDDAHPFDNVVDYRTRGLGDIVRHLNQRFNTQQAGRVVAAWNGLFFGYNSRTRPPTAFHLAPVVLSGRVHYALVNHRWMFGVKYVHGRPVFNTFHMPETRTLATEFDFAAGAAQCLIKDGQPLHLQPFPVPGAPRLKPPVHSTPQDAGHIPGFDHMKSSRASIGWSRDNLNLYLLFVKEPDSEADSLQRLHLHQPDPGGWTVADLQLFWLALRRAGLVWNAINSDAGGVGQLTYLRPDGHYTLVPPGAGTKRMVFGPDFRGAPPGGDGGTIMYFYVRDASGS